MNVFLFWFNLSMTYWFTYMITKWHYVFLVLNSTLWWVLEFMGRDNQRCFIYYSLIFWDEVKNSWKNVWILLNLRFEVIIQSVVFSHGHFWSDLLFCWKSSKKLRKSEVWNKRQDEQSTFKGVILFIKISTIEKQI